MDIRIYTSALLSLVLGACSLAQQNENESSSKEVKVVKVIKSDKEWKKVLTPDQYRIARQKGTESPFSGKCWDFFEKGHYECIACGSMFLRTVPLPRDCGIALIRNR